MLNEDREKDCEKVNKLTLQDSIRLCRNYAAQLSNYKTCRKFESSLDDSELINNLELGKNKNLDLTNRRKNLEITKKKLDFNESNLSGSKIFSSEGESLNNISSFEGIVKFGSRVFEIGSSPESPKMTDKSQENESAIERANRLEKEMEELKKLFAEFSMNRHVQSGEGTTQMMYEKEENKRLKEQLEESARKIREMEEQNAAYQPHDQQRHQQQRGRGRGRGDFQNGRYGRNDGSSSDQGGDDRQNRPRYDPTVLREINQAKTSTRNNVPELTLENFYMHLRCLESEIKTAEASIYYDDLEKSIIQQAQILCGNRFPTIAEAKLDTFKQYKTAILKACGEGTTYTRINSQLSALRLKSMKKKDFDDYLKEWETKATTATGLFVEKFGNASEEMKRMMRDEKSKEYIGQFIDGMSASVRMKDRLRIQADRGLSMIEFAAEANRTFQDFARDMQRKELDEALRKIQEDKRANFAKPIKKNFAASYYKKPVEKAGQAIPQKDKCPSHPEGMHTKEECRTLNKEDWRKNGKCLSCGAPDHIKANCPKMNVKLIRMIEGQEISESEDEEDGVESSIDIESDSE